MRREIGLLNRLVSSISPPFSIIPFKYCLAWLSAMPNNSSAFSKSFVLIICSAANIIKYIVINSDGEKLSHFELFPPHRIKDLKILNTGIILENPGVVRETAAGAGNRTPKVITTTLPGLHVIIFESSSIFFYWAEDHYEKIWTSY